MATRLLLFVIVIVAVLTSSVCADSYYRAMVWDLNGSYTELSALAGGTDSSAYSINQYGQIAGWSTNSFGVSEAVRWDSGGITDLGAGVGYSINSSGQVAGESNGQAVMWDANGYKHEIGQGTARGVNNSGQVVGWLSVDNDLGMQETHAFVWSVTGGLIDLGMPDGAVGVAARAINNNGSIAGATIVNGDYGEAFAWINSVWTMIGDGTAMSINDAGQVAGNTVLGQGFRWTPGSNPVLLGMIARGMNQAGLVTGISPGNNAAVWTLGGGVSELVEPAGYIRSVASGANDNGQVVGWAVYVPEPSSCAVLVLGLGGLIPWFRRRRTL